MDGVMQVGVIGQDGLQNERCTGARNLADGDSSTPTRGELPLRITTRGEISGWAAQLLRMTLIYAPKPPAPSARVAVAERQSAVPGTPTFEGWTAMRGFIQRRPAVLGVDPRYSKPSRPGSEPSPLPRTLRCHPAFAYGMRSNLPVVARLSSRRCASGASESGSSCPICSLIWPEDTQPRTSPARCSSSARFTV